MESLRTRLSLIFEQYLFNEEMVPKNNLLERCAAGQDSHSDLPNHCSHLFLEGSRMDTFHGQSQKIKRNPQEMRGEGAIQ